MADKEPKPATGPDRQLERAIRRAFEYVQARGIGRPADWAEIDYVRVTQALRDNGYQIVKVEE